MKDSDYEKFIGRETRDGSTLISYEDGCFCLKTPRGAIKWLFNYELGDVLKPLPIMEQAEIIEKNKNQIDRVEVGRADGYFLFKIKLLGHDEYVSAELADFDDGLKPEWFKHWEGRVIVNNCCFYCYVEKVDEGGIHIDLPIGVISFEEASRLWDVLPMDVGGQSKRAVRLFNKGCVVGFCDENREVSGVIDKIHLIAAKNELEYRRSYGVEAFPCVGAEIDGVIYPIEKIYEH